MQPIFDFFLQAYDGRSADLIVLEAVAFVFGIWSVWLARSEHIGVYPTGLISTVIITYLFWLDRLVGDMMINAYYSIMSIYGWWNWLRARDGVRVASIGISSRKERLWGAGLFVLTMVFTYLVYQGFGVQLDWTNYVDIFTSGIFFTAMWFMARKRIANWSLWIIGDLITVPLYAYRGFGMLSLQYAIFTVLAIYGLLEWRKRYYSSLQTS